MPMEGMFTQHIFISERYVLIVVLQSKHGTHYITFQCNVLHQLTLTKSAKYYIYNYKNVTIIFYVCIVERINKTLTDI